MEFYDEKELKKYPTTISFECTERILEQMKNSICRIKLKDGNLGTGFFCKIPFPTEDKLLPVLITNNHLINEILLERKNEEIIIYIKDKEKYITFNLGNRLYYTNKEYDITMIEIKRNYDGINNYLELDNNILQNILNDNDNNSNISYIKETIYIIQYPNGNLSVSYGILDNISMKKKYNLSHLCSTSDGSSGSPILNIKNNKVIGIHKKGSMKDNYNLGAFLDISIKEFINQNFNKEKMNIISKEKKEVEENKAIKKPINSIQEFNNIFKINIKDNQATEINLNNNKYGNEILDIIYELKFNELTELKLGNNSINDINMLEFLECKRLEILYLNNNEIQDITVFKKVKFNNLKTLDLGNNKISDINVFSESLENLEELNLSNNNISDINVLERAKFIKIKLLNLSKNDIYNIKTLEKMKFKDIQYMDLSSNKINENKCSSTINYLKSKLKYLKI